MLEYNAKNAKRWAVMGERPTFGLSVMELAKEDPDIIAVVADVTGSAGLGRMKDLLPEQLLNVGIAEQNMMGIATGLASEGYKVITATFAPFQAMRCLEQIRVYQGYMQRKVIMCGLASGLAYGELGHTHCTTEDAALLRAIPNIAVVTPSDCMEVAKIVEAAIQYPTSVYIRLLDKTGLPIVNHDDYDFQIGKGIVLRKGGTIALIANGTMVYPALQAAENLHKDGIDCTVVNMHTIKPLDRELLDCLCGEITTVVTIEEHSTIGGLGSAVAEYMCSKKSHPVVYMMGIPDEYPHGASHETLLAKYDLTAEGISAKVAGILQK